MNIFARSSVWTFTFIVPIVYLFLLPALTQVYLDDKPFSFYDPNERSISSYLRTPPANGGFALFTTPSVVYLVTNPISQSSTLATFGSAFVIVGFVLVILFPVGYASSGQHAIGFILGAFGVGVTTLGMVLNIRFSPLLIGIFVLFIVVDVFAGTLFFVPTTVFLVFEYANAVFILGFAPLANAIARPGRWIWFDGWRLQLSVV